MAGHNYRMEGIQGAVLGVKLSHLEKWTKGRHAVAQKYRECLADVKEIKLPAEIETNRHVYHLFVIRCKQRDALRSYLADNGIGTQIHYPVPCHLQKAYEYLGLKEKALPVTEECARTVLSLPNYPELENEQIDYICKVLNEFD